MKTVKSKNKCPNCGGKDWRVYLVCEGELRECDGVPVVDDDTLREDISAQDVCLDECVSCGIVISEVLDDSCDECDCPFCRTTKGGIYGD
jgi:hypothetical protein